VSQNGGSTLWEKEPPAEEERASCPEQEIYAIFLYNGECDVGNSRDDVAHGVKHGY